LVNSGEMQRVAIRIYILPVIDDYIGKVFSGIVEIAVAIVKTDIDTIDSTRSYAIYKLGLTTKVPLNIVFIPILRHE